MDSRAGGSMLNTAVTLGRLGVHVSFVTSYGDDEVGKLSEAFLKANGVNTDCVTIYKGTSRISLAFLNEKRNAAYSFYNGTNSEHMCISFPKDVGPADIVVFGSSFSLRKEIRPDLEAFLLRAREQGAILIYDPNIRAGCIDADARTMVERNISVAHIVKGSDEDFFALFGTDRSETVYECLRRIGGEIILIETANRNGVHVVADGFRKTWAVPSIEPVSTIGAGDNFTAGIVYSLVRQDRGASELWEISEQFWDELVSCAVGFAQAVCMTYDNYLPVDYIDSHGLSLNG